MANAPSSTKGVSFRTSRRFRRLYAGSLNGAGLVLRGASSGSLAGAGLAAAGAASAARASSGALSCGFSSDGSMLNSSYVYKMRLYCRRVHLNFRDGNEESASIGRPQTRSSQFYQVAVGV